MNVEQYEQQATSNQQRKRDRNRRLNHISGEQLPEDKGITQNAQTHDQHNARSEELLTAGHNWATDEVDQNGRKDYQQQ